MGTINYLHLALAARTIIRDTANSVKAQRATWEQRDFVHKGDRSLVTELDVYSERRLSALLKDLLPGSGIIAEEEHKSLTATTDYVWVIDPIDGTTNFVHQIEASCISVALRYKDETVAGFVHDIYCDICYWATENSEGAFANDKPIHCTPTEKLSDALIATGYPSTTFIDFDAYMSSLGELMHKSRGIRRLGSAALDLAFTACGKFDIYFEGNLNPWDVAAGAFIVEKSGGIVVDFKGEPEGFEGKQVLAGNPELVQQMLEILQKYYK